MSFGSHKRVLLLCCCSCELLKWAGASVVLVMDFFRSQSPQIALSELVGSPYACPFVKSILTD